MEQAESVYNLIPKEEVKIEKVPRYMSKFREQVKQEKQMNKSSHKTMGPPKVEIPSPEKFLRKYSKAPKLTDTITSFKEENLKRIPISTRSDNSWMRIRTPEKRDYVKSNAIDIILSAPRKPQPSYAFTKNGDKQILENSGLVPKYVNKKDYGQIPEYLQQRKVKERKAQEEYDEYVREHLRQGAMKQLSDEERLSTLQGLKKNLEQMYHQYQCLSIVIDTIPKRNRKEKLESQMKGVEKDIDLIERHKTIYIANN